MDEKLQNILDSVQKTAETVGATASDAASGVGKKASQLLSVGKMNIQLMDLKTEVGAQLREVGEMVYATHTGNPTDSDALLGKLQVIDGLNSRIDALNAELCRAKDADAVVCPNCGTAARSGDRFCRGCGRPL